MKSILLSVMLCGIAVVSKAQNGEKIIRDYFMGYEKKDWNMVASQLTDDFTFTSPNHDDHISLTTYKERCWGTSQFFKKIEFSKIIVQGNCAFATYNITTTDNKIIRNTEYYTFSTIQWILFCHERFRILRSYFQALKQGPSAHQYRYLPTRF